MRTNVILFAAALLAAALAGCAGGADEPDQETQDPVQTTQPPAQPPDDPDPEPEPFQATEVLNTTMQYDVQQAAANPFSVPAGAGTLNGGIDVMPREVCSTLQPNADQEGPSVVFTGPNGTTHAYPLTKRSAACNTTGDTLEEIQVSFGAVTGDWTVEIMGVGNVDVLVELTARE